MASGLIQFAFVLASGIINIMPNEVGAGQLVLYNGSMFRVPSDTSYTDKYWWCAPDCSGAFQSWSAALNTCLPSSHPLRNLQLRPTLSKTRGVLFRRNLRGGLAIGSQPAVDAPP
ncbi:hypothetical protein ACJJTC_019343 [Scirpophaga incertulas]